MPKGKKKTETNTTQNLPKSEPFNFYEHFAGCIEFHLANAPDIQDDDDEKLTAYMTILLTYAHDKEIESIKNKVYYYEDLVWVDLYNRRGFNLEAELAKKGRMSYLACIKKCIRKYGPFHVLSDIVKDTRIIFSHNYSRWYDYYSHRNFPILVEYLFCEVVVKLDRELKAAGVGPNTFPSLLKCQETWSFMYSEPRKMDSGVKWD